MRNCSTAFASFIGRTIVRTLLVVAVAASVCVMPSMVLAQTSDAITATQQVSQAAGISTQADLVQIIGRIINVFLGFLGIIFLGLMLYAGYMYMTAAGDPEQVKKATATIRNAIIGLVIIASAWAITSFILGFFAGDQGGFGAIGGQKPAGGGILTGSSGSLGNGEIESVLPEPNSKDNPRNTPIFVTFKHPVYPGSFVSNWTDATSNTERGLNADNIKIYRTDGTNGGIATALTSAGARVFYTSDLKTYVIKPVQYLGSPTVNSSYKVELKGGSAGIKLNKTNPDGTTPAESSLAPVFVGSYSAGYAWQFEVSTLLDLTPPVVTAVIPPSTGGAFARNVVIQLNFNKAMDPTTVTGVSPQFSMIQVAAGSIGTPPTTPVSGEFKISNHYRTVEFLSDAPCGDNLKNSCGVDIFCLPPSAAIQVTAQAATVDANAPPQGIFTNNGYDGVVSAVGNSLDGNALGGDGKAEGPPADNFSWNFTTNDQIILSPPQIISTEPDADPAAGKSSNIPLDQLMVAKFDRLMQSSTINSDNAKIDAHGRDEKNPDTFWYSAGMQLLNDDGSAFDPTVQPYKAPTKAAVALSHRVFQPSGDAGWDDLNLYDPYLYQGLQDAYQNCFNPAATCGGGGTNATNPNCCKYKPNATGCKTPLSTP